MPTAPTAGRRRLMGGQMASLWAAVKARQEYPTAAEEAPPQRSSKQAFGSARAVAPHPVCRACPAPTPYTPVGRGRSNSGRAFAGYVGNLTHVSTLFSAWGAPMPYPDLLTLARDLRVRAEEISTRAETFHNADAKQKMREIAATYVKLAERLEQH